MSKLSLPTDDDKNFTQLTEVEGNAFLKFYRSLPERVPGTIRFFFRKDYYVVYDEDAYLVADECYNSRTVIKYWDISKKGSTSTPSKQKPNNGTGIPFINLSVALFESILKTFVHVKRMRIEIYSIGDDRKWFLWKKGTPGNLYQLEDLIYSKLDMQYSNVMVSVRVSDSGGQRIVGAAFTDVILKKFGICEFVENEQFTNFESFLLQIGARECLVLPKDSNDKNSIKIHEVLDKCSISITEKKKVNFDSKSIEQDLKTLLGNKFMLAHSYLDMKIAMSALACLISELELLSNDENIGNFTIYKYDLSQYMRLDSAATQALNLVPNPRDPSQKYNLYGLLNKCKTSIGSRKLMQWIKQPLLNIDEINRRLNCVEIFVNDVHMLNELRSKGLRGISDLERISKKIQRGKGTLQDCISIYNFANKIPTIISILNDYCGDVHQDLLKTHYIQPFEDLKEKFQGYINLIEEVVDFAGIEDGEYQINPNFDEVLSDLEMKKRDVKEKMKRNEYEVKQRLKNPDHFTREYDKVHGWVYRMTKKEEKILSTKENKKLYTIVSTNKNGVKFQNSELKNLSDQYNALVEQYEENCTEIISKMMTVVLTYTPLFETAHEIISDLDVISSFAVVSNNSIIPYTKPIMFPCGEGNTILKQSRHPILEAQPDINFIANDVDLIRGESQFIIITGPNMGGKSTYIRQVGVIIHMAQIGCFIPCDEGSTVSICDAILARIGAGDIQLRGISTFMAEMLETSTILSTATKNSLIIVDELGRGTSTYDGFGLAWAISEYICNKIGAFCLFATHFHELTQLADEIPFVKNKHVSAIADDKHGLVLQYQVCDGPSDQSFGIHVAKVAKFPDEVIHMAEEKAKELEHFDHHSDIELNSINNEDEAFIDSILSKFSNLPIDQLSKEEANKQLNLLLSEIEQCQSPHIKELLNMEVM